MNKKIVLIATSVLVGTALLATTAFASLTGATGYDAYKTALKSLNNVENATIKVNAQIKDNGNAVLSANSSMKVDKHAEAMSQTTSITADGTEKTVDMYSQDGKMIIKTSDSDVYNVQEQRKYDSKHKEEYRQHNMDKSNIDKVEKVVDALVGDMKNNFTLKENEDGTKDASFELTESQVPAVVNAVLSIAAAEDENIENKRMDRIDDLGIDPKDKLPRLVDNVIVKNITANAKIDKNDYITGQNIEITVCGNDEKGAQHTVVLTADFTLSGYNSTTPDKVDLTGKNIKNINID